MDDNEPTRSFTLPMPRDRETSPKRKRTDVSGAETDASENAGAGASRLNAIHIEPSAMRSTIGRTNNHDKLTAVEQADAWLQRVDEHRSRQKLLQGTTFNGRLLKTMTAAQNTQAQAGRDLLVLTDKLHDWARHLDAQEHWLHEQEAKLIKQQHDLTRKHLDAAMQRLEKNLSLTEESLEPSHAEQIEQLTNVIGTLETTIEVLLSELMIEREARKAAEEKLQAKVNTGGNWVVADAISTPSPVPSLAKENTGGDWVVDGTLSAASPAKESTAGEASENKTTALFRASLF